MAFASVVMTGNALDLVPVVASVSLVVGRAASAFVALAVVLAHVGMVALCALFVCFHSIFWVMEGPFVDHSFGLHTSGGTVAGTDFRMIACGTGVVVTDIDAVVELDIDCRIVVAV